MTDITEIVRVNSSFLTSGVTRNEFGRTLFVYPVTSVATAIGSITLAELQEQAKHLTVRVFANQEDIEAAFDSGDAAYEAGEIYFQQDPFPRNFLAAGWFKSGAEAFIWGGPIGDYSAITAPDLEFVGEDLTLGDISSETTANIATTLQAQLRSLTGIDNAEVSAHSTPSRFVIRIPVADLSAAGNLTFSGTSAAALGLDTASTQRFAGTPAEAMGTALSRIAGLNNSWYWLTLATDTEDTDTDVLGAASWVAARPYHLIVGSTEPDALVADEDDSLFARLHALGYDRVTGIWSYTADYKAVALAGTFSSVSFSGSGTLITGKFRVLTGTKADNLTNAQTDELRRKRVNFYELLGGDAIISSDGTTFGSGTKYIDSIQGIDWMNNAIATDLYSALRTTRRIPNNADGIATIEDVIAGVCEDAVTNGLLAPIRVSNTMAGEIRRVTGNENFNGVLSNGYIVYARPVSELTQSQRDARETVAFNVFAKLSGAVHEIEANLTFEN